MGLNPLFMVHVKLMIRDIESLVPHAFVDDVFYYKTHAITRAHVMGIVVGWTGRTNTPPLLLMMGLESCYALYGRIRRICIQWAKMI